MNFKYTFIIKYEGKNSEFYWFHKLIVEFMHSLIGYLIENIF